MSQGNEDLLTGEMPRYFFSGVVHPERAQLTISRLSFSIPDEEGSTSTEGFSEVVNNQYFAVVRSNEQNIYTLRNEVRRSSEEILSIMGFLKGYAYTLEIVKVYNENTDGYEVFGIDTPVIAKRNERIDLNEALREIMRLSSRSDCAYLAGCLKDLTSSMRYPIDTGFFCYRAIESLRQACAYQSEGKKNKQQWEGLSKMTGKAEGDIALIRKYAHPARHGDPIPISDEDRAELFENAWDIVEQYLNHLLSETGAKFRFGGS